METLHKMVINFNSTFLFAVVPKVLIKYLLHASHDSLGHVGATTLSLHKKALLLPRHEDTNMLEPAKNVKS